MPRRILLVDEAFMARTLLPNRSESNQARVREINVLAAAATEKDGVHLRPRECRRQVDDRDLEEAVAGVEAVRGLKLVGRPEEDVIDAVPRRMRQKHGQ